MMKKLGSNFHWLIAIAALGSGLSVTSNCVAQTLPPLRLMSPLSSISLDGLLSEAEAAYSSRNLKAAEDSLLAVLDLDAGNRRALFRLGNIAQQRSLPERAAGFYRELSKPNEYSQGLDEIGEKALINIALLGIASAREAIAEIDQRQSSKDKHFERKALLDELDEAQIKVDKKIDQIGAKYSRPASGKALSSPAQTQTNSERSKDNTAAFSEPQVIRGNMTVDAAQSDRPSPKRKSRAKASQADSELAARAEIDEAEAVERPQISYLKGTGSDRAPGTSRKNAGKE